MALSKAVDQLVSRPSAPSPVHARVDLPRLERELRRRVKGEVRFERDAIGAYAYDASLYRQLPLGVVIPRDEEDVVRALEICRGNGAPVLPRGCGTSLAGQCCNFAVVFDFSKYMNQILELDPERRLARVQPGVICDQLRDAAQEHGLTFAADPATHDHCTLGGMIGNNACGTHSLMGGKTVDNVIELDAVLYDGTRLRLGRVEETEIDRVIAAGGREGEIYSRLKSIRERYGDQVRQRFPDIPRRVSGYNLDSLLPEKGFHLGQAVVGSEGTLLIVLSATVRLVPSPPRRSLLVLGFKDVPSAARAVPGILEREPVALEGFNHTITDGIHKKGLQLGGEELLPKGRCWLLVEFGGKTKRESDEPARATMADLKAKGDPPTMKLYDNAEEETAVWEIRRHSVGASRIPPYEHGGWPNYEDAAVDPERLGDYLADLIELCDQHGYHPTFFGHFGQGCVHTRMDWKLRHAQGIQDFMRFMDEATDLVVSYGGSISGEHGDGHGRAAYWPKMFGSELMAGFAEFKHVFDPDDRMNPGKLINPYRPDQHLREGTDFEPVQLKTRFAFPNDAGSFAEAAGRCFGVGMCRHLGAGTMCPSFMVTREEIHSTRGRARLLNEMMINPANRANPWRDEAVKQALDLCLACKGCKGDCPVQVDMATYKAEFLSHYYEGRLRPLSAYLMGLIPWWARIASHAPRTANLATHFPVASRIGKAVVGLAPQREAPRFAPFTFKSWFQKHAAPGGDRQPVVLFADTFVNHFQPEVGIAAVEVLEAAGFRVDVPTQSLCCGRPLFDYGMLDRAESFLSQVLEALRPQIRAGIPVVVLEPSCAASFKDELVNLLSQDEDAKRLARQTHLLPDFLVGQATGWTPPRLARKAIVQAHCHQGAVFGKAGEKEMLKRLGLDFEIPESGCCGLAGSFGYERGERYEVSIRAGERVILPLVREASKDTLMIADGFSCRSQIKHGSDRQALHIAQVLQMALREGSKAPRSYPERDYVGVRGSRVPVAVGGLALAAGGLLAAGALASRSR